MAAGDIAARNNNGMADLQALLATFKGTPATTTTQSSKEDVSVEKANAYIKQILESTSGLAAVSSGQKAAGMYGSTTNQLLTNDLLARTSAAAAQLSSNKTTTSTTKGAAQMDLGKTIAGLGLNYAMRNPKEALAKGKKAYSWIEEMMGGGGSGTAMSTMSSAEVAGPALDTSMGQLGNLEFLSSIQEPSAVDGGQTGVSGAELGVGGAAAIASMFGETAAPVGVGNVVGYTGTWGASMEGAGAAATGAESIGASTAIGEVGMSAEAVGTVGGAEAGIGAGGSAAGGGAGMSGAAMAGWGALAAATAINYADTFENGSKNEKIGTILGGLGTGNVIRGLESGDILDTLGPFKGLVPEGAGNVIHKASGWIICTELNKQGRLPNRFYYYGAKEFAKYDERGKQGYYIWAIPSVTHLRKHPTSRYSKLLEVVFNARAEYLSAVAGLRGARKTLLGAIVTHGLYAFCWLLSRTVARKSYTESDILGESKWLA